ncbi:I78 family peptidase inhibitor [Novosphingobium chloroacetimidivorans]|uniref:I78 family peptidase inhibitor n=1 Tax=Novosphingobium chloroacetimidivorans TaxID=1428314 RepID=UPI00161511D2|nr:I78 family peptidase inhibitor [Novosphingobium chloroacetimidivorans]
MSRIVSLASMATVAMLAGCTAQGDAPPATTPAPAAADACGAAKVTSYIGTQRTDEVIAKIKSASGAQALRVVGPNDAMTMDFREDRLTITTDESGRIKTLRCV